MNLALAQHIAHYYNRNGRNYAINIFGEDSIETIEALYSWLLK